MMKKILLVGLLIGIFFVYGCVTDNVVKDTGESVSIPMSDLSSEVKFYEHDYKGTKIRYFAVLGSDGKVRTAFDACDVCGGNKGYRQEGEDIVCNNCGKYFKIDGLGTENHGYGCWPSFLPHEENNGEIVINVVDIEKGGFRFA